jgi:hypothetical protein
MANFRIDPERSQLIIDVRSNVHPIEIRTTGFSGTIEVEVGNGQVDQSSPVQAEFEIAADLLRSGIDLYDEEIQRRIGARMYRSIRGQIRSGREVAPARYRLNRTLSLHGVTREIEGDVDVRIDDGALEIDGSTSLDTRDYEIEPPRILMLEVNPKVTISALVRAARAR